MKFILGLLVMVALVGAGCSSGEESSTSNPSADDTSSASPSPGGLTSPGPPSSPGETYWTPYQFTGTESFEFDVEESKKGETKTGHYSMKLRQVGGKYTLAIEGKMGDDGGSLTGTADKAAALGGMIVGQPMLHPWVGPLTFTLFEPGMLDGTFGAMRWEVGSKWKVEKKGKTITLEIPRTCKYAGQDGRLMRMSTDGNLTFESCVSKDVSVPLYVKTVSKRGAESTVTLTKYEP